MCIVNVWGKHLKLPQLTHESFLTIDHSCKIFFWYLPNWTSTNLWCVVLYATYSTTHQRSVEVQFGKYQKNILQEWSMVKNLSCVSCATWNVFLINSLVAVWWETVSTFALVKHADVSNFCLVDIESDKVIFHGHVVFNRVLHTRSFPKFLLLYFDAES